MNRARRRKRSFQKARDKVEKREEEPHQGMAIRGIDSREKKKHKEEEKSKASSERSLDLASSTNFVDKSAPQDEKINRNNKDTTTIPEVFDSSKYDSMTEMKELADMKAEGHLKEVLSSVEKEEPVELAIADTRLSNMDTNPSSTAANATVDASPPSLEEKAATLRGSKEEQTLDKNLDDGKDKSQEVIELKDKEADTEQHPSRNMADPYTIFWRNVAKSWNDFYIGYARNASDITRYWSQSWLFGYKKKK